MIHLLVSRQIVPLSLKRKARGQPTFHPAALQQPLRPWEGTYSLAVLSWRAPLALWLLAPVSLKSAKAHGDGLVWVSFQLDARGSFT